MNSTMTAILGPARPHTACASLCGHKLEDSQSPNLRSSSAMCPHWLQHRRTSRSAPSDQISARHGTPRGKCVLLAIAVSRRARLGNAISTARGSLGEELCAVKVCVHKRQRRGGAQLWLALLLSALFSNVLNSCVPPVNTLFWTAPCRGVLFVCREGLSCNLAPCNGVRCDVCRDSRVGVRHRVIG
jgi:hypothetical protein